MDQNRLLIAIVISIGILIGFEYIVPHQTVHQLAQTPVTTPITAPGTASGTPASSGDGESAGANGPRVQIDAARLQGSVELVGAELDDLVLKDYHTTVDPKSPLVRLLQSDSSSEPSRVQFGWLADSPNVAVPNNKSLWQSSGGSLTSTTPVTLSWDNGQGLVFQIRLALDQDYMFSVTQTVRNNGGAPVVLQPWARIRRGYTMVTTSYGGTADMLGVFNNQLHEVSYKSAKSTAEKADGVAYQVDNTGGWAGVSDKYWLTAVIPDQAIAGQTRFLHIDTPSGDGWQVDFTAAKGQTVAPGSVSTYSSRAFVGAKELSLLDYYQSTDDVPNLGKSVDFGWLYFFCRPIFFVLDWIYGKIGNFGLAIMTFTVGVKLLFFPLANRSYRSMNKMRALAPKMKELRERFKDDSAQLNTETMALYRTEKVNPASGCLPMVIQIPVFWALYRVLGTSIEMRHTPFFGWIHDLSAQDPTNVFNLFGLIPFDPTNYVALAHLGVWPLIMGATMYFQQRLNPQVPDPVQARMMQFMPLVFTFMMGRAPAGLVIYWSWNNLLSLGQQWLITRQGSNSSPVPSKI